MKIKTKILGSSLLGDMEENVGIVMPILTECDVDEDFAGGIEKVGETIPILALRNMVLFPGVAMPVVVGRPKSMRLIKDAAKKRTLIGVVCQKDMNTEEPAMDDLYSCGVVAELVRVLEMPDGNTTVILQGKKRFMLNELVETEPYLQGKITLLEDEPLEKDDVEQEVLMSSIKDLTIRLIGGGMETPKEVVFAIKNNNNFLYIVNFSCNNIPVPASEKQKLLEVNGLKKRAYQLLSILSRESQLLELKASIQQ